MTFGNLICYSIIVSCAIGSQEQLANFLYNLLFFYTRFYIDTLLIISAATDPVMSKRRRGQELFSREAVIARLKEKSDVRENINKVANYRSAKSLEIAQILNGKDEIGEKWYLSWHQSEQ